MHKSHILESVIGHWLTHCLIAAGSIAGYSSYEMVLLWWVSLVSIPLSEQVHCLLQPSEWFNSWLCCFRSRENNFYRSQWIQRSHQTIPLVYTMADTQNEKKNDLDEIGQWKDSGQKWSQGLWIGSISLERLASGQLVWRIVVIPLP